MPVFPRTESTSDEQTGCGGLLTAPLRSAYNREFRKDNRGVKKGSQSRNSTNPTNPETQHHRPATGSTSQQPSIDFNTMFRPEAMKYQQVSTEPPQDWSTNVPTGSTALSQSTSRPNTSNQQASQSHNSHRPTRDGPGRDGVGIDYAPQYTSGEGGESVGPGLASDMLSCFGDVLLEGCKCLKGCFTDSKGNFECPCCLPGDC